MLVEAHSIQNSYHHTKITPYAHTTSNQQTCSKDEELVSEEKVRVLTGDNHPLQP